ncbi:MAG: hypothetical protein U0Y10_26130 [Spirosomataceae bacterium]
MKKIISYTLGWDTEHKQGYLTVLDESQQTHVFGNLTTEEFALLSQMLKENRVYIDQTQWIVVGWRPETHP